MIAVASIVLPLLLLPVTQSALTDDQVRERMERWFSGPLAHLTPDVRERLVRLTPEIPGGVRALTSEEFRGRLYLEVLMNSAPDEGHSQTAGTFDRMKAVTEVVEERLIPVLHRYAAVLNGNDRIYGIKLLLIELPANAFIQLYVPTSRITEAARGRLTRQQLLDSAVLYVNHDAVQLKLVSARE